MPELKQMKVNGRPAIVAHLSELGGELVEPEEAKLVIVRFENGEVRYYFRDEEQEQPADA